ncbi:hypothetical protein VIGAN_11163900 [Vigna angularis var. angularis]|nr:hypothetical protein VIGAN_11163900 [Vigna angularis var. angularis]
MKMKKWRREGEDGNEEMKNKALKVRLWVPTPPASLPPQTLTTLTFRRRGNGVSSTFASFASSRSLETPSSFAHNYRIAIALIPTALFLLDLGGTFVVALSLKPAALFAVWFSLIFAQLAFFLSAPSSLLAAFNSSVVVAAIASVLYATPPFSSASGPLSSSSGSCSKSLPSSLPSSACSSRPSSSPPRRRVSFGDFWPIFCKTLLCAHPQFSGPSMLPQLSLQDIALCHTDGGFNCSRCGGGVEVGAWSGEER